MPDYKVYTQKMRVKPGALENHERFWLSYSGPLDEIQTPYPSRRGTFPLPDIADKCLWLHGRAVLPLIGGDILIRVERGKREVYKYNRIALCLELDFNERGIRRKPVRKGATARIPGSYDRCVHSTKREQPSWRVFPSCGNPSKGRSGNRYHIPNRSDCVACPSYRYDRQLMKGR